MKKILILSANPKNTNQLRLDEEVREIKTALRLSKNCQQFEIVTESALRVNDLRRSLLDNLPHIVHFSGHGLGSNGLMLEDKLGEMQLVSSESLAGLFELFENLIECVVLNACYSEVQAEALFRHIDCVIGMNQAIGDKAAIEFSTGFYDGLCAGRSYRDSFEFGCSGISLQGIPESKTPQIKVRKNLYAVSQKTSESSVKIEQPRYSKNNSGISQTVGGGTVYGGMQASQGNNNQLTMTNAHNINTSEQHNIVETASEIKILLQQLERDNPSQTNSQKIMVVAQAVEEIENNSMFKSRVMNALKAGRKEAFKELINHPLVNVFMAAIDNW